MAQREKIAAAYIRVSTEDQAEYSPVAQLAEIRRYAGKNGFTVPERFVFLDEGISGKQTAKRDAFNRMIGTAKRKPRPFDAILLWKFSRFARNREDSVVYKSMLRKQLGIDVISVSEPVGDDKMSILIEALIEAMDEYYSINLAEEVKRGMTEKARRGGLQSNPAFGYRAEQNRLVPVPEEAELVQLIYSRFLSGDGLFRIARRLNVLGVKTHRGRPFENRTVEYILRNPVYLGKLRWNPAGKTRRNFSDPEIILADAGHEALIDEETWDKVQKKMTRIKESGKSHGRPLEEHADWISGLVRCSECGSTLVFARPHYWKCNGYVRGACKSSQHTTDAKLKEMLLARLALDLEPSPELEQHMVRGRPAPLDFQSARSEQISDIDRRLRRLLEAYLAGVETLDRYAAAKAALERRRNDLAEHREEVSILQEAGTSEIIHHSILALLQDPKAPLDAKKRAAHAVIDHCIYSKAEHSLTITYRVFEQLDRGIGRPRTENTPDFHSAGSLPNLTTVGKEGIV